jgi:hypothetical protein
MTTGEATPTSKPPDAAIASLWWQRREILLGGCVLLTCGVVVGLVVGWSVGKRIDPPAALALPGNKWRLKSQGQDQYGGKDSFIEFKEDSSLVTKYNRSMGVVESGNIGKYKIGARDEITIELDPGEQWRVVGGRFKVMLAGDNVILESQSNSERVFCTAWRQETISSCQRLLPAKHQGGKPGKNTAIRI